MGSNGENSVIDDPNEVVAPTKRHRSTETTKENDSPKRPRPAVDKKSKLMPAWEAIVRALRDHKRQRDADKEERAVDDEMKKIEKEEEDKQASTFAELVKKVSVDIVKHRKVSELVAKCAADVADRVTAITAIASVKSSMEAVGNLQTEYGDTPAWNVVFNPEGSLSEEDKVGEDSGVVILET